MVKYICPYCGEQEKFIIDKEYVGEYGIQYHDKRVRCGNCYRIFNDNVVRELSGQGFVLLHEEALPPKTTGNRAFKTDPLRFFSMDLYLAMVARFTEPTSTATTVVAAEYFKKAYDEFPDHWESVFFDALFTAKTNTPIQNLTYYKIYAMKMGLALNIAARTYKGEELRIAVNEIVEENRKMIREFTDNYIDAAQEFLNGSNPKLMHLLVSMDVSIVYDVLADFFSHDPDFYYETRGMLHDTELDTHVFFSTKSKYIVDILLAEKDASWRYPISYVFDIKNPLNAMGFKRLNIRQKLENANII